MYSLVLLPKNRFPKSINSSQPISTQFQSWFVWVASPEVAMVSSGCDATVMAKAKTKKSFTILNPSMTKN